MMILRLVACVDHEKKDNREFNTFNDSEIQKDKEISLLNEAVLVAIQ